MIVPQFHFPTGILVSILTIPAQFHQTAQPPFVQYRLTHLTQAGI